MHLNKYIAEFLGIFVVIIVVLVNGNPFVIGATLTLVMFATSPISGGHINPVVSLVKVTLKQMEPELLVPYLVAQLSGCLADIEVYRRYAK